MKSHQEQVHVVSFSCSDGTLLTPLLFMRNSPNRWKSDSYVWCNTRRTFRAFQVYPRRNLTTLPSLRSPRLASIDGQATLVGSYRRWLATHRQAV